MSDDSSLPPSDPRRKHARTSLSMLVQYRCNSFDDFLADYSVNLSVGGIFIRTPEPKELGEMIYLQFSLRDGSKLIEGLGRVVHVNVPGKDAVAGMGVEFVSFDEESMALIESICAKRRKP